MRALLVFAAGCNFSSHANGAIDGAAPDVASDVAIDAAPDARLVPFCDTTDPALMVCYEFEGDAKDASTHGLDATTSNVSFVTGRVGKAMQFANNSAAEVADSAVWDVAELTIEAWIKPTQLPTAGNRMGIVDMNGQYGLFLHETGRVQCTMVNGVSMQIDAGIQANQWAHVACSYDGAATTIYIDGVQKFQQGGGGALATTGTSGISIAADNPAGSGSRLIGLIDQVKLVARAYTAAEVCRDAQCTPTQ